MTLGLALGLVLVLLALLSLLFFVIAPPPKRVALERRLAPGEAYRSALPRATDKTVMAVALQVRASRGAETVEGALRAVRRCALAFVLSCLVISLTHDTVGWISIVLIWLGHVTITGAELWQSASDWGFQSELSDHRRLGDYQGIWSLGYQAEPIIFPGLFTFLALQWGPPGWAVIAALAVTAAVVAHPAARAAERFLAGAGAVDPTPAGEGAVTA